MPGLLTYHHHEFPPDLHWQAVSLMRVEWPFIEGGLPKETYPAGLRPVHFAVAEAGVLISYAAVIRLEVEHAGEAYRVCGLGNVLTYPACRGQGYGRQVVDAATQYIAASDADVAALFCEPTLESFYARSGWEAIREAATLTGSREAPAEYDALRMMLFVSGKGKAGRHAFETRPLHIEHGW
jgi:predicted N-acetyltransferase YhbS